MIKRQRDSFGNAGILLPKDRRIAEQDVCVCEGVYIFVIINIIMILVFFCLFSLFGSGFVTILINVNWK